MVAFNAHTETNTQKNLYDFISELIGSEELSVELCQPQGLYINYVHLLHWIHYYKMVHYYNKKYNDVNVPLSSRINLSVADISVAFDIGFVLCSLIWGVSVDRKTD